MKAMSMACTVVVASALVGCSLLYNPNNLPPPQVDAAPDAPTIVAPNLLRLDVAGPRKLLEGQGTGGSRPAILAITGINIAPDATVALVPTDPQSPAPMIEVDNNHAVRSPSGVAIAVPVTLPIDPGRTGAADVCAVALTVQVTQMGANGPVMQALAGQVSLCNLPELDAAISDSALLAPLYARVNVPAGLSFATSVAPALVRAVASIDLGDVHADGKGQTPGPGGGSGGDNTKNGGGAGGGRPAIVLVTSASGGGYGQAGGPGAGVTPSNGGSMSGDDFITSYLTNGSGGGGGGLNVSGGGGGGTLELTAGGTLKAGTISTNGAGSSNDGGGGSGGAIILRSGATATIGAIKADGGTGGSSGGKGGGGRLRYDVPAFSSTPAMPLASRRGVAFEADAGTNPLVTTERAQSLNVISVVSATASTNIFDAFLFDASGTNTGMMTFTFVTTSVAFTPPLTKGYNHVCVTPHGKNPLVDVAVTNCIDIAYVP